MYHRQLQACSDGAVDKRFAFLQARRHWLFHNHVASTLHSHHSHLQVTSWRGTHVNNVWPGFLDQLACISGSKRHTKPGTGLAHSVCTDVRHAYNFDTFCFFQIGKCRLVATIPSPTTAIFSCVIPTFLRGQLEWSLRGPNWPHGRLYPSSSTTQPNVRLLALKVQNIGGTIHNPKERNRIVACFCY